VRWTRLLTAVVLVQVQVLVLVLVLVLVQVQPSAPSWWCGALLHCAATVVGRKGATALVVVAMVTSSTWRMKRQLRRSRHQARRPANCRFRRRETPVRALCLR
jgi:hypothetical protein